jgi:hypothetical protein
LANYGILVMADPKSPIYSRDRDRRSAFNRRWIKSDYSGKERRSGSDRREDLPIKDLPSSDLPVPEDADSHKRTGLERLLVTNTIQLEALTRILLEKGTISDEELMEMMNKVQIEYRGKK